MARGTVNSPLDKPIKKVVDTLLEVLDRGDLCGGVEQGKHVGGGW